MTDLQQWSSKLVVKTTEADCGILCGVGGMVGCRVAPTSHTKYRIWGLFPCSFFSGEHVGSNGPFLCRCRQKGTRAARVVQAREPEAWYSLVFVSPVPIFSAFSPLCQTRPPLAPPELPRCLWSPGCPGGRCQGTSAITGFAPLPSLIVVIFPSRSGKSNVSMPRSSAPRSRLPSFHTRSP